MAIYTRLSPREYLKNEQNREAMEMLSRELQNQLIEDWNNEGDDSTYDE